MARFNIGFTLVFMVSQCISFAQSKFSFSLDAAPIYTGFTYRPTSWLADIGREETIQAFNDSQMFNESPGLGITANIGINYRLGKRVILCSGLGYKNLRTRLSAKYELIYPNTEWIPDYEARETPKHLILPYISLPLHAQYNFLRSKKISVSAVAGPELDLSTTKIRSNHLQKSAGPGVYYYDPTSLFSLALAGGFKFDYELKKNIAVFIQPMFVGYLTNNVRFPINSFSSMDKFYRYGQVRFGINYSFKCKPLKDYKNK